MHTTVYLIRHGETVGGQEKRYKGQLDVPLSPAGERQLEEVAGLIEKLGCDPALCRPLDVKDGDFHEIVSARPHCLDHLYCSDLSRARRSAEIIGSRFGLIPHSLPAIRERNFGKWEGMSFEEIMNAYPKEFEAWAKDPNAFSPMDGESTLEVKERVMPAFNGILRRHIGQRIAVVAHGGVNRVIICELLGIPLQNLFRIEQDFACLNIFEIYGNEPVAKAINYT